MISNLAILAGAALGALCVAELSGSPWWGLLVVAGVLVFAGFVNAPTSDGPASAEVKKRAR